MDELKRRAALSAVGLVLLTIATVFALIAIEWALARAVGHIGSAAIIATVLGTAGAAMLIGANAAHRPPPRRVHAASSPLVTAAAPVVTTLVLGLIEEWRRPRRDR